MLNSKERSNLRSIAQKIEPITQEKLIEMYDNNYQELTKKQIREIKRDQRESKLLVWSLQR